MFPVPDERDTGSDVFDSGFDPGLFGSGPEPLFMDPLGMPTDEGAIVLTGRDLERFQFRLDQSLQRAINNMDQIHKDAADDRAVYRTLSREQEYEGQPNLTTPISANKVDGFLAQAVDAMEQRPLASFVPEGIGRPAERAAQVAPLCAAYLEREINRGGSRERLIREASKEAGIVGTGILKLAMIQHPSGEWFATASDVIPIERFFVDRLAVPNLKHAFCGYERRIPFYQLEEMADTGLLDRDALDAIRGAHSEAFIRSEEEKEADFLEQSHAFQEETAVHKIHTCYLRFRPAGQARAEIYEAMWSAKWKRLLSVRKNPVAEAFDHPPLALHRVGKVPGHLFGRGIVRRLAPIQNMADNAINSHLALNNLAASPPFMYKQHSPFGRLLESKRRILPGIGIPTVASPDQNDVKTLDIQNPGLSLQDISVAQNFADRATYTEESVGSTGDRKTLGQFRIEAQRGTMRIRLDLGDLAYDARMTLTMLWSMMVAYKVKPAGVVEVEEGGKFLGSREIDEDEINEVMDGIVMPLFAQGDLDPADLAELEEEFNGRLTDDIIPSARRSDLTIHLTGTKIVADKATELDMLNQLTPVILQGIELAHKDSYWNYHLRSIVEAMGFKDIEKRIPADPGQVLQDGEERNRLGAPLAETITRSSNMV